MTSIKNWQILTLSAGSIFGTACWIIWMLHGFQMPTWKKCQRFGKYERKSGQPNGGTQLPW